MQVTRVFLQVSQAPFAGIVCSFKLSRSHAARLEQVTRFSPVLSILRTRFCYPSNRCLGACAPVKAFSLYGPFLLPQPPLPVPVNIPALAPLIRTICSCLFLSIVPDAYCFPSPPIPSRMPCAPTGLLSLQRHGPPVGILPIPCGVADVFPVPAGLPCSISQASSDPHAPPS